MKLIKPSFTIVEQGPGIEGIYKQIEMAGRTCYKSEDKITETSAKEFVDRMIKSGHGAMLEHGTVYLKALEEYSFNGNVELEYDGNSLEKYINNPYSKYKSDGEYAYVTTNLRVLVENGWMDDLQYISEPTEYHARRITVKFTCDRGVTHEFVRHRVFSFAQESTRYCNYSKDKFGNNVTYIIPCWTQTKECEIDTSQPYGFTAEDEWICMLGKAERHYFQLINKGWKAQEARAILPTAVKAELVMTGFVDDWKHFFHLRTAAGAHPQARELARPLQDEFVKRNYMD